MTDHVRATEAVVEHHRGTAAELHALDMPTDSRRRVWVLDVVRPAVVLGSTQSDDIIDGGAAERLGVDVARRRSGGGAVFVAPGDPLWVDVFVPWGDPWWTADVGRSFLPIGAAWARALGEVGIEDVTVHDGPLVRTPWSELVCFAGVGAGEVLHDGAKLIGISQRRTRAGARFQCAIHRRWNPDRLIDVLAAAPDAEPDAATALAGVGVGLDDLVNRAGTAAPDHVIGLLGAAFHAALAGEG